MGVDLDDQWSHLCLLDEAGTHFLRVSELLHKLSHELIVANVRELRAITHNDRKSDRVDAQKLARYARVDPQILRPFAPELNERCRPHLKPRNKS